MIKKQETPPLFLLLVLLWGPDAWGCCTHIVTTGRQASHRMPTQNPNIAEALNLLCSLILTILKWRKIKCLPFKLLRGLGVLLGFLLFAEFCEIYSSRKCWKMKLSTLKLITTSRDISYQMWLPIFTTKENFLNSNKRVHIVAGKQYLTITSCRLENWLKHSILKFLWRTENSWGL